MATLETQYKNWLKENEPIEYSEWLEKFSEIHHLDKIIQISNKNKSHDQNTNLYRSDISGLETSKKNI
jgi:hypothetical protein